VLDASDDAVFSVDADRRITDWNRNAERIFGYLASETIGRSSATVMDGDGAPQVHAALETAWTGHAVHHLEVDLQRCDGMTVPISLTVVPVIESEGTPCALVVVARDITERQVAQAALAEAELRVRDSELLEHDGRWLWDVRTGAVQWTDELHRVTGLDPSDFAGTFDGHLAVVHVDDRDGVRDAMEAAVAKGEVFEIRCRIVRPDGSERVVEVRGVPAAAYAGTVVGLRGTIRDVAT
jgi:hypothetical protein